MSTELALFSVLAAVTAAADRRAVDAASRTRSCSCSAGSALAVIPGIPEVELEPEIVLLVVILPPLLYAAAFFTPLRELRRNVRPISLLAVGLVLATMVAVAVVAHEALGFGWARGVRARRDRLAHRPGRGDRDRPPARRPAADRHRSSRARA